MDGRTLVCRRDIMQLYYKIASRVAFRIYVHGMDHQDKVQECVIKAWSVLGEKPTKNLEPLIYTIMKNHLVALSRTTYNERCSTKCVDDITIYAKNNDVIKIPLPKDKNERVILLAWLEHSGKLTAACKDLGINYWSTIKLWNQTKDNIRKLGLSSCVLDQEYSWLMNL